MTETTNTRTETGRNRLPEPRKGGCAAIFIDVQQEDGICALRISGRFATGADFNYLSGKLDHIRSLRNTRVLADFTDLVSIGSTGISFLISLHQTVTREPGGRLVLAGASPLVLETLDLTGLSKIIPLAKDFDSGLAALQD